MLKTLIDYRKESCINQRKWNILLQHQWYTIMEASDKASCLGIDVSDNGEYVVVFFLGLEKAIFFRR